jgi:hypothetical protein
MKAQVFFTTAILFLLLTPFLSAQNTLPDPHNDACWQSLASLRACQLEQSDRETDYAQRCTSYPEYQCLPADEGTKNTELAGNKVKKLKNMKAATSSEKAATQTAFDRTNGER